MLGKAWSYATRIPLKRRFYQVFNAGMATAFGKRMELVHVVEYPRCGGTWIRHMLQSALDVPQYSINRFLTHGTIIQTHSLPQPAIRKPIVVLRDPRDALVSFYFKKVSFDKHLRKDGELSLAGYSHDPVKNPKEDFCDFLACHLKQPDHPRFTFSEFAQRWVIDRSTFSVKYEDCKSDAQTQLRRMVEYLGKEVSAEKIAWAVSENSFEKRTERRSGQARAAGEESTGQFERKGIVGDWMNLFSAESVEVFQQYEGRMLVELGYEPDDSWIGRFLSNANSQVSGNKT